VVGDSFGRNMTVQLYEQGRRWGGDIPVSVADDLKVATFIITCESSSLWK